MPAYGKHVLTPTLALTSFAGATPPEWSLRYWDENLLQGPPPDSPVPAGRGDHRPPHLRPPGIRTCATGTAAARRRVILGGLHVISCPEECAPHADALVFGDGSRVWPDILSRRRGRHAQAAVPRVVSPTPTARIRRRAATCSTAGRS